mmetsp:Transcript_28146/g.51963  ORF Transcript_28146/g.51963 Transcript_28146/m.51963 type:complete len:147 (+) Transcript_28146:35-475(+)
MKWFSFLSLLPVAALGFQQVKVAAPIYYSGCSDKKWDSFRLPFLPSAYCKTIHSTHYRTSLNFFPEKFSRAEQCATHYGTCNLDELEELANELNQFQINEGELQGRDHYKDTKKVTEMLRTQSELKHAMEDYVNEHHDETFDMSDV